MKIEIELTMEEATALKGQMLVAERLAAELMQRPSADIHASMARAVLNAIYQAVDDEAAR